MPEKSAAADNESDSGGKSEPLNGIGFNRYWYVGAAAAIAYLFFASHVISFLTENVNETVFDDAVRPLLAGLVICVFVYLSLFFGRYSKIIALTLAVSVYIFSISVFFNIADL